MEKGAKKALDILVIKVELSKRFLRRYWSQIVVTLGLEKKVVTGRMRRSLASWIDANLS